MRIWLRFLRIGHRRALWSAVNLSPNRRAGGRPSCSGTVPALQGALVRFTSLQISQFMSSGNCVYLLCRAPAGTEYFDFTMRCFCRCPPLPLAFRRLAAVGSSPPDEAEGLPSRAESEVRSSSSIAEGLPSLEPAAAELPAGLASSRSVSTCSMRAANTMGTS